MPSAKFRNRGFQFLDLFLSPHMLISKYCSGSYGTSDEGCCSELKPRRGGRSRDKWWHSRRRFLRPRWGSGVTWFRDLGRVVFSLKAIVASILGIIISSIHSEVGPFWPLSCSYCVCTHLNAKKTSDIRIKTRYISANALLVGSTSPLGTPQLLHTYPILAIVICNTRTRTWVILALKSCIAYNVETPWTRVLFHKKTTASQDGHNTCYDNQVYRSYRLDC